MVSIITISVPQEIKVLLDEHGAKSQLMTRLLKDYFKYDSKNVEEVDVMLMELKDKEQRLKDEIEAEKEKLLKTKEFKEKEINDLKEAELLRDQKRIEMISNVIDSAFTVFNCTLTEAQAEEYLNGDYPNLKVFVDQCQ